VRNSLRRAYVGDHIRLELPIDQVGAELVRRSWRGESGESSTPRSRISCGRLEGEAAAQNAA
jgi:hypothetical protein